MLFCNTALVRLVISYLHFAISVMLRLKWLFAPSTDGLLFATRLCLAMAGALYLSMWLQLDRPYWASLEVAVMIQPIPGMAVVRGFARASGTIIAGCAGLVIVALFAQSYVLTVAALALWVALCSFGASLLRNNLSYGFAIAGFIAGVIVALSHTLPQPPFEIAVARVSECVLAAVVASAVNVLFSPPAGARRYFDSRVGMLRNLADAVARLAGLGGNNGTDQDAAMADDQSPGGRALKAPDEPHAGLRALWWSRHWPLSRHANMSAMSRPISCCSIAWRGAWTMISSR